MLFDMDSMCNQCLTCSDLFSLLSTFSQKSEFQPIFDFSEKSPERSVHIQTAVWSRKTATTHKNCKQQKSPAFFRFLNISFAVRGKVFLIVRLSGI